MKFYFFTLLTICSLATCSFSWAQKINAEPVINFHHYDSTYDFVEVLNGINYNPKELIGQDLEFANPSTNCIPGSSVSVFDRLRDSFFLCFSTSKTVLLSSLTNNFPGNFTGFDLVDGSRHPNNYSYSFLKDTATTNAYKPKLLLTAAYPFAYKLDNDSIKKAIVVGTPYSALAGKSFKIKDATCFFDYYDSQVWYFFTLIDSENNEVTFFTFYDQALMQMIHIKGYIKKFEENNYGKIFTFKKDNRVFREFDSSSYIYMLYFTDTTVSQINIYDSHWRAGHFKYVSTPKTYFQTLYLELINQDNQRMMIYYVNDPEQKEWQEEK